jgi:hypothetical protein
MNDELQELVRFPREDLDIELKQWVDPGDKIIQSFKQNLRKRCSRCLADLAFVGRNRGRKDDQPSLAIVPLIGMG